MEALKQLSLLLLFGSAAAMIVWFLLPSGGVSRTAKSVISVFMLLCALLPLYSFKNLSWPRFSAASDAPEADYGELFTSAVKQALGAKVKEVVTKYTDVHYLIVAGVHINGDHSIEIEQVRIVFDYPVENAGALVADLTEALGLEPVLAYREGE